MALLFPKCQLVNFSLKNLQISKVNYVGLQCIISVPIRKLNNKYAEEQNLYNLYFV